MQQRITINLNTDSKTTDKTTILEYCRSHGIAGIETPCGGKGTCGKCKVTVAKPYYKDVLACQTKICDGMEIIVGRKESTGTKEDSMVVLTNGENVSEKFNEHVNRNVEDTLAACDIGTTTVVCHLLDGATGVRLCTVSAPNAQRSFGADVISRIQASVDSGLDKLQSAIVDQINGMLVQLKQKAGRTEDIRRLAVAGNTVMSHLFCGLSPESIGVAPFTPLSLFGESYDAKQIGIEGCETVYVVPSIAGYVGGDIVADLAAVQMHSSVLAEDGEKETLMLDIGTNGEMVLGKSGSYVCCATAAGPAFEGAEIAMGMPAASGAISKVWLEDGKICCSTINDAPAVGICGSGLIDALAVFLETELLDETGLIADEDEVEEAYAGYLGEDEDGTCVYLTDTVKVTQADVRKLQLAKASIAAGIRILLSERNISVTDVEQVILAGGFGSFLNKKSAAAIGLIPEELEPVTRCAMWNCPHTKSSAMLIWKKCFSNKKLRKKGNKKHERNFIRGRSRSGRSGINDFEGGSYDPRE